jgi:phasin family protein
MLSLQDHLSSATRFQMESQLDAVAELTDSAVENLEKLVELNLNLIRVTLEQLNLAARQVLAARDVREMTTLTAAQVQPNARRALDYSYYLSGIASAAQLDFIKVASARIADTNLRLVELLDDLGKSAPAGLKATVAWMKSASDSVNLIFIEVGELAQKTFYSGIGNRRGRRR